MPRKTPPITQEQIFEVAKYMGEGWSLPVSITKVFGAYTTRLQTKLLQFQKLREMQDRHIFLKRKLQKMSPQTLVTNHLIALENMERSRLGLPLKPFEDCYMKRSK